MNRSTPHARRIPSLPWFDHTLAFWRDPYRFVSKRSREVGSEVFAGRLLLKKTIFMGGPKAAAVFYDRELFTREDAAPGRIRKTLFGSGGVQGTDGAEHLARKDLLLSLLTSERRDALGNEFEREWTSQVRLSPGARVVLYNQLKVVLFRACCRWAGVSDEEPGLDRWARRVATLYEGAGRVGLPHARARSARRKCGAWATTLIRRAREEHGTVFPATPLATLARARGMDGRPLDAEVAGVELLNILRPTTAVSVFITHLAHALHTHRGAADQLGRAEDPGTVRCFVQETRRVYPFFPAVVARTRREFESMGYRFPKDRRVILDLYGTTHDAGAWSEPDVFSPERFRGPHDDVFTFIPQGGGDTRVSHRCAGEALTIELMERALRLLRQRFEYSVPEQDLDIDYGGLPALPGSGFLVSGLRLRGASGSEG